MKAKTAAQKQAVVQEFMQGTIVRATRRVMAENGYDGTSVELIAKEAGISPGTIYLYFRNKDDLLTVMIEQGIDVNLPTAEPRRIDVADVLTITVAENERVYLENQRVTIEELRDRLGNIHTAQEDVAVLVKADSELKYGKVVEVLDTVRGVGISRLAMATKPVE